MAHAKEIAPVLSEGVDRKALRTLKERFLEVNLGRLQRMLSTLSGRHKNFVDSLPILLHLNHPSLPGYVSGRTPCGIETYTPLPAHLNAAQSLARSFHYRKNNLKRSDIVGIYLMGSTGTVAHSEQSDMDFWVCHRPGISLEDLSELRDKLDQISAWADELGLEAHFFIMDPMKFRYGERGNVSGEDCGSAQHFLLLDEFYRTGLVIAGCMPLWWMVPNYEEKNYELYAKTLLDKRFIPREEYVDFGGIHDFPPGEFIGAGMWQLYKGIDSPYKSVLKIVLTEIYASEYPHVETLSQRYKNAIYLGNLDLDELDPYIMVYRKIEDYLQERGEERRLELIRHCLYFKVNELLTRDSGTKRKNWRRELMQRLTIEWGWDEPYLKQLDNRKHWKVNRVRQERQELVQELNYSYRFLSDFARDNEIEASINQNDMNILGRKLYAAFERKGGKIELVNPGITPDLTEDYLSFHFKQDKEHPGVNDFWMVYRGYYKAKDIRGEEPIKKARSIIELIAWCYFNKLMDGATRYSMDAVKDTTDLTDLELQQIINAIGQLYPNYLPKLSQQNFEQAAHPTAISIFVNVGVDPMIEMTRKGIHRLSDHTDALSYSALKHNLALTVDQITVNSWGEIICSHYHSENALIDCLVSYMRQVPPIGGAPLPKLEVRCFSPSRGTAIAMRVEELFRDIIACYYSGTRSILTRYLVEIEQYIYVLQFKRGIPVVKAVRDYQQLHELVAEPQAQYSHIVVDQHCLEKHPLSLVARLGTPGKIQIFYLKRETTAEIYCHDENGSIFHSIKPLHDEQSLLIPLHHFLQSVQYRRNTQLGKEDDVIKPVLYYEITGTPGKTALNAERKKLKNLQKTLRFFNVQAIGEQSGTEEIFYTIYCGDVEFSQFEHGEGLFKAVANHITSLRKNKAHYPCYITDLDLTQVMMERYSSLQTVEYLQFKDTLETEINTALGITMPTLPQ